jgi:hypothetical protein
MIIAIQPRPIACINSPIATSGRSPILLTTLPAIGAVEGSLLDAYSQALLVGGHNPLTLLHNALSSGLHEDTDGGCLSLAQAVRVVLVDLSERLSQALRDEAELNNAVSRLMGPKT